MISPFWKALFAVLLVIATAFIPFNQPYWLLFPLICSLLWLSVERPSLSFVFKRFLQLEPILLCICLFSVGSRFGWQASLVQFAKANLSLLILILISNSLSMAEGLSVLKRLKVPPIIIQTMTLAYRYSFLLLDESSRMKRACDARCFTKSRGRIWRLRAYLIGNLFVRASDRAERVYRAMIARGWHGIRS